jgi:hypothetical protein
MSHDLTVREDGTVEMFSAGREPVWHRLGQRTETAVTSQAAIRLRPHSALGNLAPRVFAASRSQVDMAG